jgi:hypothetical protein
MFRRIGLIVAAFAALLLVVSPAAAQYDPQRPWHQRINEPQPAPQFGEPQQIQRAPQGAACVPSGFARLSRNCNVNTGACQRMPENCSLGWCCP